MLLSNVETKAVRDRSPLALGVGVGLGLAAFVFTLIASGLETDIASITEDLPDALTAMMGGGGGNYVITEIFGLIAPIAILVVAISGGLNVLAREESRRTADLLLTQPVTRRQVVVAKAAVLFGNITAASALFTAGAVLAAATIDIADYGPADTLAGGVHLYFLGLAFAGIALAASNITGSTSAGMGISIGVAVLSNLLAALAPLVDGAENLARISPWYYFNGSEPLQNGVDPVHLVVLAALAAATTAFGVFVVERRDVGARRSAPKVQIPALGAVGRVRVNTVFAKSLSERVTLIGIAGGAMGAMAVAMCLMYDGIKDTLSSFSADLPSSVMDLIGVTDMGTPAGWIQAEMLSIMVPLVLVAVGIVMGVNAVAGEDDRRTLALLLAVPVSRRRILTEKAAAMVVGVVAVGTVTWIGIAVGAAVSGMELSLGHVAAAMAHVTLLGIFFGALSLAIGSATSQKVALRFSVLAAVTAYLGQWLPSLNDTTDSLALLSPWHYASAANPIENGVDPLHLLVLVALSGLAILTAIELFERRELNT